jgi:hypothetical protein
MGDSFDEVLHSCRRDSMKLAEFAPQIGKLTPSSPNDVIEASRIPEAESECQIMERALGTLKHLTIQKVPKQTSREWRQIQFAAARARQGQQRRDGCIIRITNPLCQ